MRDVHLSDAMLFTLSSLIFSNKSSFSKDFASVGCRLEFESVREMFAHGSHVYQVPGKIKRLFFISL